MLLTFTAVAGLVTGVLGICLGAYACRRARGVVRECLDLMARQAASTRGAGVDPRAIRDVAVYRYDALEEMSGRLSFSVALINSLGDGIALTSINGRSETRTYVRPIRGGRGVQPLSPEEEQAVRAARLGLGPDVEPGRPGSLRTRGEGAR
ncbi:DUF4446 family protein [Rhizohabitans arisaemae]|uniref:DUF4446 family protein n=1 Tax=Rhizohabitans arisaemae TaxID=2720610 RepID=UPI0024B08054|nr:DUF4446 family protein [Rhizohabitans arisaemae]